MSAYYGVSSTPNDSFLAHYGVKGMKWGVRKALERGDLAAYKKHYAKAKAKLEKLRKRADRDYQKEEAKANALGGAVGLGLGAAGGLASYGIVKGQIAAQRALLPNSKYVTLMHPVGLYGASALSAGTGLGLLTNSAVNAYRASKTGNRRAVQKYNRFKKEMNNTFKAKVRSITPKPKHIKSNRDPYNGVKKDVKNGLKAAALSTVMGPSAAMYVNSRQIARDAQPIKRKNKRRR